MDMRTFPSHTASSTASRSLNRWFSSSRVTSRGAVAAIDGGASPKRQNLKAPVVSAPSALMSAKTFVLET